MSAPTRVSRDHLEALYATGDDPWEFRTSAYEAAKFEATLRALPRRHYARALEIGCGNGELARRLAPICAAYTGIDAVGSALTAARLAVPHGWFVQDFLPCALPSGDYDLILLSEILYFLDAESIAMLARQIDGTWPTADVVTVVWCGLSGNPLEGDEALDAFSRSTLRERRAVGTGDTRYRIDTFSPLPASP